MPGRVPVPMASSARSVFGGITEPAWKAFSISHMMPSHDDVHLNTDRRSPFFYPFMLLLLMLSLCAYEDDRETICAGCFAFHEPAFVIIAGMMRAWFHMVPEAA